MQKGGLRLWGRCGVEVSPTYQKEEQGVNSG